MSDAGDMAKGSVCGWCAREGHRFTWPQPFSLDDGCPCCIAGHAKGGPDAE